MDAVTYLKTYERMREAEGLATFERLFNEEATPEQRVELVEEWGRENPVVMKNVYEQEIEEARKRFADKETRDILAEMCLQIVELQIRMADVETELEDLII